jgi:hypothetical protein
MGRGSRNRQKGLPLGFYVPAMDISLYTSTLRGKGIKTVA